MRTIGLFVVALLIGSGGMYLIMSKPKPAATERAFAGIKSYFSPKGGCTEAIVLEIVNAKTSIFIQAYSFTSDPIETALIDAHKRGVEVRVVLDRSQYTMQGGAAGPLFGSGLDVRMDCKHTIQHNKVMIIDGQTIITGSFNFTRQAEISNAENLLIIHSRELAQEYAANWQFHYNHSEIFDKKLLK